MSGRKRGGRWFLGILVAPFLGLQPALSQGAPLTFNVVNDRNEEVYVYFANAPITGTLPGGGPIVSNTNDSDSTGYTVPASGKLNGFTIDSFNSGRVFVSLGDKLESGNGSQFNNKLLADYHKRFDHFEVTFDTANSSSAANLTGTDFISMPLQLDNGSTTAKWTTTPFSQALTNVVSSIKDQTVNTNGYAIVTGGRGVSVAGVGAVVRIIAPSTATAVPNFTPYGDIGAYHDAMKAGSIGNQIHVMSNKFGNDYNLSGSVDASTGDVELTKFNGDGAIQSITVESRFFTGQQIYGANPTEAVIDGTSKTSAQFTANEAAAIRDIYAGFNLGVWGSTEEVGGKPLGQFTSQKFFELGSTEHFFSAAQSNSTYYNEFAELIAANSDNAVYGFPYSDVLGGQLIPLDPAGGPTLTLTILPDAKGIPEMSSLALPVTAAGLAGWACGLTRRLI